jgi:hypothetical protein
MEQKECYIVLQNKKQHLLFGDWFVSLQPGWAQLNMHIVKVFCDSCDIRCVVLALQKPDGYSIGLAPFLEHSTNHCEQ